jgi:hypothetical protein
MRNPDLYWSGVVMAGLGGWTLGMGLGTKHQVTCAAIFSIVTCEETGANRSALLGVGAALIGTGAVLGAYGGKRVTIAPSLRGVVGTFNF